MSHIPSNAMPHTIAHDLAIDEQPAAGGIARRIAARLRSTPALIAAGVAIVGGIAAAALPLLRRADRPAARQRRRARAA